VLLDDVLHLAHAHPVLPRHRAWINTALSSIDGAPNSYHYTVSWCDNFRLPITIHTPWTTIYTPWTTIHTPWTTFHTPWTTIHTPWTTIHTPWTTAHTPWITIHCSPPKASARWMMRSSSLCTNSSCRSSNQLVIRIID
jgi:hypothetical protein